MLDIAVGVRDRGIGVAVVAGEASGPLLDQMPRDIELVDLTARRSLQAIRPLIRYLSGSRPSALLCAGDQINAIALFSKYAARWPGHLVLTQHHILSRALQSNPSRKSAMAERLAQHIYKYADAVVAVSQGIVDDLVEGAGVPPSKTHLIYNPVRLDALLRLSSMADRHPWLGDGGPPVVLGVGRLEPEKDFETLIRGFAVARRSLSCRLVILGEGTERPRLEALVHDLGLDEHVAMPGFESNPYPYFAGAHAFALSSRWEGFGIALAEALAFGLPVVSTDCESGPREILKEGQLGRLVPVEDHEALGLALCETLRMESGERKPMHDPRFDFDAAVDRYLSVLGLASVAPG